MRKTASILAASSVSAIRCTRRRPSLERMPLSNGSNGDPALRQLAFEPLVPIQTELGGIGKVGAELDEERAEVAVEDVDVVMIDHRGRADDPGIGLPVRVPPLLGAEDAGFLLRLADEQHAFLAVERARYCCATSSFRCPFSNVTRSTPSVATNRSMASTNRWLIGATIIVEGTRAPSCVLTK